MTQPQITQCAIAVGGRECLEPAHVVFFAAVPGPFGGVQYDQGAKILVCLMHGGQIYDGLHQRAGQRAAWLDADRWVTLPTPWSPYRQVTPAPRARGYQAPYRTVQPRASRPLS